MPKTKKKYDNSKMPIAILTTFNLENNEQLYTEFIGEHKGDDVVGRAEGLWRGIKEDWPNCLHVIYRNARAAQVMTNLMLGKDPSADED